MDKTLKGISMRKENYKPDRSKVPIKVEINNIVAQAFSQTPKDSSILILDSELLFTRNTLVKHGISEKKIEIPNNSSAYKKISKKHYNTYNMSLGEYIELVRDFGKNEYGGAWFDYCGTPSKNLLKDIDNYFDYKLPKNNSYFAATFCHRISKAMESALNRTTEAARRNGYRAELLPVIKTYRGMFFFMFKIKYY